jgi:hypothetical protein
MKKHKPKPAGVQDKKATEPIAFPAATARPQISTAPKIFVTLFPITRFYEKITDRHTNVQRNKGE